MIALLLTGRKGSVGFPGKHFCQVRGHELAYYPIKTAGKCEEIDVKYLSTNDDRLMQMAIDNNIQVIKRPEYLCSSTAVSEDVLVHGYNYIRQKHGDIDIMVLLMCNAPCITSEIISRGIKVLQDNPSYDSAVTVSSYNMWSPVRARKIGDDNLLHPFIPFEMLDDLDINYNSNRDTQGKVWFADMGVSIVRSRCIENIENGILPQKWMGRKIYPLQQEMGLDVDYEWEINQADKWLELYGEEEI